MVASASSKRKPAKTVKKTKPSSGKVVKSSPAKGHTGKKIVRQGEAPVSAISRRDKGEGSECGVMGGLCRAYRCQVECCHIYLDPLLRFAIRFCLAYVFFMSAILKLPAGFLGVGQGNWDATIALFTHEYAVPLLSPAVAAFLGTGIEVVAPLLLLLGLATRLTALVLLVVVAVMEFSYQHSMEHLYWALLLGVLLVQGAGRLSMDYCIRRCRAGTSTACETTCL